MTNYIRRYREQAGLTQEKFAEKMKVSTVTVNNWESGKHRVRQDKIEKMAAILNVSLDTLISEGIREENIAEKDNWPGFLFDDETNAIIDTLHLDMAQQDLFGLMYIYDTDDENERGIGRYSFDKKLKNVPYGFIEKVGSIRFMNQAEGLKKVIKNIDPDFLIKVLKLYPDSEFDIRKLPKELICEFIDEGWGNPNDAGIDINDDRYKSDEGILELPYINIKICRIILPILEEIGPVHMTDGWWSKPIRKDIPQKLFDGILEAYNFNREAFQDGYYKDKYTTTYICRSNELVTDFKNVARKGARDKYMWSINDKGRKFLKWLEE